MFWCLRTAIIRAWGPQAYMVANQAMEESHDHFTERHTSHRSPQRHQPTLGQRGRRSTGFSVARVSGDLVCVAQADSGARGAVHGHRTDLRGYGDTEKPA